VRDRRVSRAAFKPGERGGQAHPPRRRASRVHRLPVSRPARPEATRRHHARSRDSGPAGRSGPARQRARSMSRSGSPARPSGSAAASKLMVDKADELWDGKPRAIVQRTADVVAYSRAHGARAYHPQRRRPTRRPAPRRPADPPQAGAPAAAPLRYPERMRLTQPQSVALRGSTRCPHGGATQNQEVSSSLIE